MSPSDRRAALSALDAAAPQKRRLGRALESEDSAADIIELWDSTETALRSLLGGAPFSGRVLVGEVRRRELISIGTAHALIDFLEVRERADDPAYAPTQADADAARAGYDALRAGLAEAAPREEPDVAPPAAAAAPPPPPAQPTPPPRRPFAIQRKYLVIAGAGLLLLLLVVAGVALLRRPAASPPELAQGVAAYQQGRRDEAMTFFARAALRDPNRAAPFLWMARVHRERGEFPAAVRNLQRAGELEPRSADVHRELASYFFARGNYEQARQGYVRALQLDPVDRGAQGYLACSLLRLGRPAEAQRWFQYAGPGPWTACLQVAPQAPPP